VAQPEGRTSLAAWVSFSQPPPLDVCAEAELAFPSWVKGFASLLEGNPSIHCPSDRATKSYQLLKSSVDCNELCDEKLI